MDLRSNSGFRNQGLGFRILGLGFIKVLDLDSAYWKLRIFDEISGGVAQ